MVVLETKQTVLNKLVGKKISLKELEEILFNLGFELDSVENDNFKIEIGADRPDLLSSQGLARAIRSYLGLKINSYKLKSSGYNVKIQKPIKEWPYAVAAIVKKLKFDDENIREVINIQEKLGATFLRNRKKGGIGLYPLEKIKFPVTFTAEEPSKIVFRPLEYPSKINGLRILEEHPTGQKYKHIVESWKRLPIFKDDNGDIMSLPPVINSHELGKISETTTDVFIECTGTDLKTITIALEVLVSALIDMGGEAYSIEMDYSDKKITTPDFKEENRVIKVERVNKLLGSNFKSNEIKKLLLKMGYTVKSLNAKELRFVVPGTRSDIWHDVDIIDDIARAYGFNNFQPRIKPVNTIGDTTASVKIKDEISKIMVGLGYQEVFTLMLTSKQDQFENMCLRELNHIKLSSSVEQSINIVRVWLLPELMKCLKNNRSVTYPQRLFEINYVTLPDDSKDVKSKDILRLCIVSCHSNADFTEAKQVLDVLARLLDFKYEITETEHSSFIPGRVARVSVKGKELAYIGEIKPEVLSNFGLQMPVSAFELNLTELFRLL